jgi:SsrA-binding protein
MSGSAIHIKNKKAKFEYELLEKFTAGMQLLGTEIKSIRDNKASIAEAYCAFQQEELFVKNLYIAPYEPAGGHGHEERRDRKLLLNKQELSKLRKKMKDQGMTIVPTLLFISDSGYAKLSIALAKGKKLYDKRESLKQKDIKRDIDRLE